VAAPIARRVMDNYLLRGMPVAPESEAEHGG